jgi:hypothetical protein
VKRPTNTPKSNPLKTSQASWWTGWTKPLQDLIHTLDADIAGLKARLRDPIHKGRPAVYAGIRDFLPEQSVVQVNTAQTGTATNPCNYIVRDGQDYDIPIIMPGPGVFVAEEITVAIFQQQYAPVAATISGVNLIDVNLAAMQAEMRANTFPFPSSAERPYFTTKFSIYPQQLTNSYLGTFFDVDRFSLAAQSQRTINYLWNMVDTKSQRRLADAYISQMVLTPPSAPVTQESAFFSGGVTTKNQAFESVPDGDLFRFCTPWVFERDGQVNFTFRPITPVFQFDSSLSGTDAAIGLPYDDRINGVRDQRVRVQVEIHGYRFETDQDLIRAGALTR